MNTRTRFDCANQATTSSSYFLSSKWMLLLPLLIDFFRLMIHGVSEKYLDYQGTIVFAKENNSRIPGLVSSILPSQEEVLEDTDFQECITWIKWLMFENDPANSLDKSCIGQHYICGAIWCNDDISYKCSTCEVDETSAMCISCFEHGDHSGHDYTVTHYRGGCCDCGDITKLKPEGFCSEHKGILHPLGDEPVANSMALLLMSLMHFSRFGKTYLDAYGAEDDLMLNRRQLFLNEERYAALAYMVSSHGLDRNFQSS